MTLKLSKKAFVEAMIRDFKVEVAKHATAKKDWLVSQAFVDAERNFPLQRPGRSHFASDAAFEKSMVEFEAAFAHRHIPFPEPIAAHFLVALCVGSDGDPDYEIIDDLESSK